MLTTLPDGFLRLTDNAQAQSLLAAKAADAKQYGALRETAIRCAPEK